MSFEVSWYIPQKVIHLHITGHMEIDNVRAMTEAAEALVIEGAAPVHILLDDALGGRPPVSLSQLKEQMPLARHDKLGWIVGIGDAHPIAMFIIPLLMKVLKINFVRYPSIDDALDFLMKHDPTLLPDIEVQNG